MSQACIEALALVEIGIRAREIGSLVLREALCNIPKPLPRNEPYATKRALTIVALSAVILHCVRALFKPRYCVSGPREPIWARQRSFSVCP
jgi:hypothetical protein